ncbi:MULTISPECIES: helix-turn-helix domain-containing protein [unclassified Haladaptatus]|uniref:helix-turn-helix domain-containing protein n=1 Tax=unclassified Haladaptatus TaxID=2622732 RepID=UPI00209C3AC2|nr:MULTISPECIES: helix-turn-helix domain-containing protein [unclassified Haladaptatus]MCO8244189.1 helix-turn-helix domain-containing protein [Haladaptatus sp. AB643]MCO8255993.1 helix-turn-helix domain-containing protein [Haladaptatus sp. AB618]
MKYARLTGTPDPERTPEIFDLLARSSFVDEARLYDWNLSNDAVTALLEVDGERERFRDEAADVLGMRSVDTTRISERRFTLLAVLEPTVVPLLQGLVGTISREGLVVAKPLLYRDGQVHARIVGSAAVLQRAVDEFPAEIALEISAIGEFDRSRETPLSGLSDRQREALLAAFDLGYYEHPRRATHEDVAARLDCAPNTASEHLQKAEIKLVTDVLRSEFVR